MTYNIKTEMENKNTELQQRQMPTYTETDYKYQMPHSCLGTGKLKKTND